MGVVRVFGALLVGIFLFLGLSLGAKTTYTCHDQATKTAVKIVVQKNPAKSSFVIDSLNHEFKSQGKQLQIFALYNNLIVQAVSMDDPNVFAQLTLEIINTQKAELSSANISSVIRINDGKLHEIPLICLVITEQE